MIGTFKTPLNAVSVIPPSTTAWTKPSDWIDISTVGNNEINLLVADMATTQFSIITAGTYSINWGDGTVETGRTSATTYYHTYSLGSGTACSRGYTTFKIRIYGASSDITRFQIQNPSGATCAHNVPILWCVMGTTNLNSLANAFSVSNMAYCGLLECLALPNTLGTLLTFASMCSNCYRLIQVTGPSGSWGSLVGASGAAFTSCFNLKYVQLPNSWGSLSSAQQMFNNCYSLETVILPSSWGSVSTVLGFFVNCYALKNVILPTTWGSVTDVSQMFQYCESLTNIILPTSWGSVTTISAMFQNCQSLQYITLPSSWGSVTNTSSAFYFCSQLKTLTLPATMGNITNAASMFYVCYELKSIVNFDKIGSLTSACSMLSIIMTNDSLTQSVSISSLLSVFTICGQLNKFVLITSIRLTNPSSTFGGTSPQVNVSYTSLNAAAIDLLFGDLPTLVGKSINISSCPGAATCTRSIATAKGWTITG